MVSNNNKEDFYSRLEEQLIPSQKWPGPYIFKFIVKSNSEHLETIKKYFQPFEAKLSIKHSSKNTYISLSVNVLMQSPKEVISMYKKVGFLEGVMAL